MSELTDLYRETVAENKSLREKLKSAEERAEKAERDSIKDNKCILDELAELRARVLAQSLAIKEKDKSLKYAINALKHSVNLMENSPLKSALSITPSPGLGAKIVETLEFYAQGNEWDYGKKSEETLRLIREQGKETKNG